MRLDIRRIGAVKEGDEVVGNETRVKVVKNKVAPPFRQTEFQILYGKGIHRTGEILELGVKHGIVEKSGAWYAYGNDRIGQGRKNASEFLDKNPAMRGEIESRIRTQLLPELSVEGDVVIPEPARDPLGPDRGYAMAGEGGRQRPSTRPWRGHGLLARREHGRAELQSKLIARGVEADVAAGVVEKLRADGLQSEGRFAAALVRRRIERGYGPVYIRGELRERRVDDDAADAQMNQTDEFWLQRAMDALLRKFPQARGAMRRTTRAPGSLPGADSRRISSTALSKRCGSTPDTERLRWLLDPGVNLRPLEPVPGRTDQ